MWQPVLGMRDEFGYATQQLTPAITSAVNVATGDLVVSQRDLQIAGTGLDATFDRTFNSRADYTTELGHGWDDWPGTDSMLYYQDDGSQALWSDTIAMFYYSEADWPELQPAAGVHATFTGSPSDVQPPYFVTDKRTQICREFDTDGYLTRVADRNGNTITVNYDTSNQIASLTDADGRVVTIARNPDGTIHTITDPAGRVHTYGYTSGNLTGYTAPDGTTTSYEYGSGSVGLAELSAIVDAEGNRTEYTYDSSLRVATVTRIEGTSRYTTTLSYHAGYTEVTDPNGHTVSYHYDQAGRVTQLVDGLGRTHDRTWGDTNLPATTTTPSGVAASYLYDANENLTSISQATDGTGATSLTTSLDYGDRTHPFSPTRIVRPQGTWTNYGYDTAGNLDCIRPGTGGQTGCDNPGSPQPGQRQFEYNSDGTLAAATTPAGATTSYAYTRDSNGLLDHVAVDRPDPLGDTAVDLDTLGRIIATTDGLGQTTSYGYDTLDRLTSVGYADGSSVTYSYDDVGNLTAMTDQAGTTSFTYNALNQLTGEDPPGAAAYTYTHDPVGNLTAVTGPAGTTSYSYDAADQLTTLTQPDSSQITFGYDDDGHRTTTVYPNGVTLAATTDGAGRLSRITGTHAGTTLTDFTYTYTDPSTGADSTLRRTVTDADGNTTTYSYDDTDRLTAAVTTDGTLTTRDLGYSYDQDSNLTARTVDGTTTSYLYNQADQLAATTQGAGGLSALLVVADDTALTDGEQALADRLTQVHGLTVTIRDDSAPVDVTGQDLLVIDEAASTSAYGNVTIPTVDFDDIGWSSRGLTTGVDWNPYDQLTLEDTSHPVAIDLPGQFSPLDPPDWPSYATDSQLGPGATSLAATTADPTQHVVFAYDTGDTLADSTPAPARRIAVGIWDTDIPSLTRHGWRLIDNAVRWALDEHATTYHHDADGNLTATTDQTLHLDYNARNQTTATTLDGTTTTYSYHGPDQTYRTAAGTTVETRGVLGLTRTDNGTATVDYTYDPAGVLLARHTATGDDYYLYDGLGSTAAVTGPTGATVNRYTYDPYGTVTTATETIDNPWQYVGAHGYHTDTATGLVKVGLRYYQPDHARWTQPDPTGQEANSYLYAASDPSNNTDPDGSYTARDAVGGYVGQASFEAGREATKNLLLITCHIARAFGEQPAIFCSL